MVRELSKKEQNEYNKMIQGAKQINLFGEEEELDARDFIHGSLFVRFSYDKCQSCDII